ncbi:MAG: leucyl/phenylalanyl-tRNA--protein transferase [Dissulfurimicrobium sp.]|uniref:leucyl/phenylalanyl-tRNA--protein transferase n=1 Tax=Dissulfurimicrobium sp. TaxID=2022436 RepID=UPI00404B806D
MPVYALDKSYIFPPPGLARPDGLLAIGGDLSPERLIAAYRLGIFPWYGPGEPILWWSPDPRLILYPGKLHVSRRLQRTMRLGRFEITFDHAFDEVIRACRETRIKAGEGTWICEEMIEAYSRLYEMGIAHSSEAWLEGRLVGGLYGVAIGRVFFGESMFSMVKDASKVAFVTLVRQLEVWGFELIDCQVTTRHLISLGAQEIPRKDFLTSLAKLVDAPAKAQSWASG